MPAFDRKARLVLVTALAGVAAIAWFVMRGDGDHAKKQPADNAATEAGSKDAWAGEQAGTPGFRRRPSTGLLRREPGPPAQVTGVVRFAGTGTPVAGAEVAFMNDSGESTVTADGSGRYTALVASGVQ